jgi:uncharacterized FlaG/YvyC family protein
MSPPVEIQAVPASNAVPTVGATAGATTPKNSDESKKKQTLPPVEEIKARQIEQTKVDAQMVHLGYTVDHESNALKIKVTNQVSGEVVREFELKGLGAAHHEPLATKGVVVDDKT